ncbi:uncharacterized protein PAC_18626 [Phialocephala subalpina]|uniref:Uncharacterized protein n=1 Tax=Phialocephala subalpina TaxID=576137 RepID=A0A1L7XUR6_9HELO|nr:uncharacterized protein PAC_18626 [Phialocephala subalpina]
MSLKQSPEQRKSTRRNGEGTGTNYSWTEHRAITMVVLILVLYATGRLSPTNWWQRDSIQQASSRITKTFQWVQIIPSEQLVYHDCFEGMQCARLEVPMDWNDTSASDKIAIVVTKLPAKAHVTNVALSSSIQIADFSVGVQPPSADSTDPISNMESPKPERGSDSGQKPGRHLSTTPVVQDTVALIERLGKWRENEGRQWLESKTGKKIASSLGDAYSKVAVLKRTRWILGQEKLSYWGFSYSTVIGTTFAAMYPSRAHRIVLDGVVDVPGYYNSSSTHRSQIQDAGKVLDHLMRLCFDSGSFTNCGLFDPRGPDIIKENLFAILEKVKERPVALPPSSMRGPQIITASDVDQHLHLALYFPLILAKPLFSPLHNLSLGEGTYFADLKSSALHSDISPPPDHCKNAPLWTPECQTSDIFDDTGSLGIERTDDDDLSGWSEERFLWYWDWSGKISEVMGSRKAKDTLNCMGWKLRAKWRFTKPFVGQTRSPLLLIGNTAHKIVHGFPGSVVLQHDAVGHISITAPCVLERRAAVGSFAAIGGAMISPM